MLSLTVSSLNLRVVRRWRRAFLLLFRFLPGLQKRAFSFSSLSSFFSREDRNRYSRRRRRPMMMMIFFISIIATSEIQRFRCSWTTATWRRRTGTTKALARVSSSWPPLLLLSTSYSTSLSWPRTKRIHFFFLSENSYVYTTLAMPETAHSVTSFEPVADMAVVHHMLLFGCREREASKTLKKIREK